MGMNSAPKPNPTIAMLIFLGMARNDNLSRKETEFDVGGTEGERVVGRPCNPCSRDPPFQRMDSPQFKCAGVIVNAFLRTNVVFFHRFKACGWQRNCLLS